MKRKKKSKVEILSELLSTEEGKFMFEDTDRVCREFKSRYKIITI